MTDEPRHRMPDPALLEYMREAVERGMAPRLLRISSDGLELDVAWAAGGGVSFDRLEVRENRTEVELIAHLDRAPPGAFVTLALRGGIEHVTLSHPLDSREVIERAEVRAPDADPV